MKLILASVAIALTMATPARADLNSGEAAILGAIVGAFIAAPKRHQPQYVPQPVPQHYYPVDPYWDQRCGWYERATVFWDRVHYQRFNACDHQLIGERWERR